MITRREIFPYSRKKRSYIDAILSAVIVNEHIFRSSPEYRVASFCRNINYFNKTIFTDTLTIYHFEIELELADLEIISEVIIIVTGESVWKRRNGRGTGRVTGILRMDGNSSISRESLSNGAFPMENFWPGKSGMP